jgi:hypothetical protein
MISDVCDSFEHSGPASDIRGFDVQERQHSLERSLAHAAEKRLSLREAVKALQAEFRRLSGLCHSLEGPLSARL